LAPTCINPVYNSNSTGCIPSLSGSAFCVAGVVAKDATGNSQAMIDFPLNAPTSGALSRIFIPNSITVSVEVTAGLDAIALVLIGADNTTYVASVGHWVPNVAMPVSNFTTTGLPGSGEAVASTTALTQLLLIVTSSATAYTPFSLCLTNVTTQ